MPKEGNEWSSQAEEGEAEWKDSLIPGGVPAPGSTGSSGPEACLNWPQFARMPFFWQKQERTPTAGFAALCPYAFSSVARRLIFFVGLPTIF